MANSQKPELNRTQRLVVCTDHAGAKGGGKPNGYQQEREVVSLTGPVPDVKFTFDCSPNPKPLPIDKLLEDTPSLQDELRLRDCLIQSFKENSKAVVEGTTLIGEELDFLEANGCVTSEDRYRVKNEKISPTKSVRRLLSIMLLRDYRSLLTFVKSLGFHNQHVADVVITKFIDHRDRGFHKTPTCLRCRLEQRVDLELFIDDLIPLDDIWEPLYHRIARQDDLKPLWNEFFAIVKIHKVYENISIVIIRSLRACGFHSDIVKLLEADQRQTLNSFVCRCGEIKEQQDAKPAEGQVEFNQKVATNPARLVSPDNDSVESTTLENGSCDTSQHFRTTTDETVPSSKVPKEDRVKYGATFCREGQDIEIKSNLTNKDESERFDTSCSRQMLARSDAKSDSGQKMELLKSVLLENEYDHDTGIVEDSTDLFHDKDETELKQRTNHTNKPITQSNQHKTRSASIEEDREKDGATFYRDSPDNVKRNLTDKDERERFGTGFSRQIFNRSDPESDSDQKMELLKIVQLEDEYSYDSGIVEDSTDLFHDEDETELKQRTNPTDKPITQRNKHKTRSAKTFSLKIRRFYDPTIVRILILFLSSLLLLLTTMMT